MYSKYLSGLVIGVDNFKPSNGSVLWVSKVSTSLSVRPEFMDNTVIVDDKHRHLLRFGTLSPVDDYVLIAPHTWRVLWSYYGGNCYHIPGSLRTLRFAPIIRSFRIEFVII
jgi:hypothetical protein